MDKYVLNIGTKMLHLVDGCCHSKNIRKNAKGYEFFKTENEVISKYQKHIRYCKICFKNR